MMVWCGYWVVDVFELILWKGVGYVGMFGLLSRFFCGCG